MTLKQINKDMYMIQNYKPKIERDIDGNLISIIYCPYIPAVLVDRWNVEAYDRAMKTIKG